MSGGWVRFLGSLVFLYIVLNLFFAALFFLQPGCIDGSRPESFADSFFFSVQTLSTIGFGALSPATEYANTIVTIESAVGMLFVALATGLTFAKVARPSASVLFSNRMTLSQHHGQPTLMFRVGNARGNEIVDASMNMTALVDDLSPEGTHLRRVRDLKLERRTTPLFVLSWTVIHIIDEDSPLFGLDWDQPIEKLEQRFLGLVVTMIGHDGTYGQTVYARHNYYLDQIDRDHRFVDVIGQLPSGMLIIDYTKFHDTEPI
jgi:inward rectifier potassium channel